MATKRALAHRAGNACSLCRAPTAGPSEAHASAVNNVGVAAHICGARPSAPRYDASMTAVARSHADNGIWLCQTCAKKIDGDVVEWSVLRLLKEKVAAEHRAKERLGKQRRLAQGRFLVEAEACHYIARFRAAFVPVHLVNEGRRGRTVRLVQLVVDGAVHVPSQAISNLVVSVPWLSPPPLRLQGDDAATGAWFFGQSFLGTGEPVEAKPGSVVELVVAFVGGELMRRRLTFYHPEDAALEATGGRQVATIQDDGSVR